MLSDFFGVEPARRQVVRRRVPFGGAPLALRPLTVEQVLIGWDAVGAEGRGLLASVFTGQAEPNETMEQALRRLCLAIFPEITPEQYERATPDEVAAVFAWYLQEHQWVRIFSEVFGIGVEQVDDAGEETQIVDLLFLIEKHGGRTIEDQLSMRVEGWLSYREAFVRQVEREQAVGRVHTHDDGHQQVTVGKKLGWDDLLNGLPGEIEFYDPSTEN